MIRLTAVLVPCVLASRAHATLRFDAQLPDDGKATSTSNTVFENPVYFNVEGGYTSQFSADLMTGSYDVARFNFSVSAQTQLNEEWNVALVFRTMVDSYNFSSMSSLGLGSAPWQDIFTLSFGARIQYKLDEKWSLAGGPVAEFSRESGADWGDALVYGGTISAVYQWNDDLAIGFGIGALSQIEDDPIIVPIFTIEWKLNDTLRIASNAPTANALGGELIWTFAPDWELALGAGYARRRFRLDMTGIAPGGVGEESQYPLTIRIGWQPDPHVHVSLYGGINFATKLTLESATGARIAQETPDGAIFVGFAARFQF